uniref:ATPase H+ transporting accessory protein 1 like n=1 Tax=Poecilia formosa TaxID=48698 RepID=A0A087Y1C9_POEFO
SRNYSSKKVFDKKFTQNQFLSIKNFETLPETAGLCLEDFRLKHVRVEKLYNKFTHSISMLQVLSNGEPCILFQARKLSLRFEKQRPVDLTELTFSPQKLVDTRESLCQQDRATLVMRFGDVEDLRGLSIRFQLSNTFYESSGQWWFSVDQVSVSYNTSEEVVFNATDVYAPAASSYRCLHVSSLQRYSGLLLPSTEHAQRWAITFIDFQIQAFNISGGRFSPASDCTTVLTPAILMGLITSLILLLVLAYALHMVVHLKHIEHDDQKPDIYFPQ